jgi:acetyl esterase/lipase
MKLLRFQILLSHLAKVTAAGLAAIGSGVALSWLPAPAAQAQGAGFEQRKGVSYVTHDGVTLAGDLYLPEGAGPFPALLTAHGGAWQGGSRSNYQYWGPYLARRGYVVFNIDYRLSKPGVKMYPESVHDARAAVQFLRGSAAELKIDPARIGIMGDSAGAHLAAVVALAGDSTAFASAYREDRFATLSTKVRAVVGFYGIFDMLAQWQHDQIARPNDQITEKYLGASPSDNRRLFFEASPLSYVIKANNQTSFFITYGTADDIVDHVSQSEAFVTALKQANFYVRTSIAQSAPHFWVAEPIDEPSSFTAPLAPRLLRFLAERLR